MREINCILLFLFNEVFYSRLNKLFILICNLTERDNEETTDYTFYNFWLRLQS